MGLEGCENTVVLQRFGYGHAVVTRAFQAGKAREGEKQSQQHQQYPLPLSFSPSFPTLDTDSC